MTNINSEWLIQRFEQRLTEHPVLDYERHAIMAELFATLAEYHHRQADRWDGFARFSLLVALAGMLLAGGAIGISIFMP